MTDDFELDEWPENAPMDAFEDIPCSIKHCRARRRVSIPATKYEPERRIYPSCGDLLGEYTGLVHRGRLRAWSAAAKSRSES